MTPLTRAEATRYEETSRHADVMAFIAALEAKGDTRLHVTSFGASPQGRDLPLLVVSSRGVKTPEEARRLGLPVVLVISGIHAGEVEGKEGCLMLVRDLLDGKPSLDAGQILENLTLVVAPLFNPDGNDAIDPGNRKLHLPKLSGQLGPDSGVGTRVNAAKINLNRDYLRYEGAEMRLLQQRVCQPWAADLTIDNHATNGSVHRFSMTYDIPHTGESGRPEPIEYMRNRLLPPVTAALKANHGLDAGWYGNFVEDERALDADRDAEPGAPVREGWMTYPHHPRFGSNYRGLTSHMDLLLECYSYIPFAERVRTAYAFMLETLKFVAAHRDEVVQTVAQSRTPRQRIAVRSKLEPFDRPVEILTRTPRTLEGAPSTVTLPHFGRFVGTLVVDRPAAYLVAPSVADHLRLHGLRVEDARGTFEAEVPVVESLGSEGGRAILEAAAVGELEVSWRRGPRAAPAGWSLVPTDQPLGAIAAYLCEAESDDGAVENGLLPVPALGEELALWRVPHLGN
ncbi:M14 family metallopeptidase [Geothrix sp. 21YS21S-4]|uniref:M14 family metallopeptidase n=1 Tax=Geothrix sp. 21YS21S-4 TaxID=3068889 RepID=UPI0027BAB325|nr:M14 family metallopeptidase [Geothrix sp. 21YS21S-4]